MVSSGSSAGGGLEVDEHELRRVVPVAVLDGVDDRFPDRHADPVQRVVVEPDAAADEIADDLDEIQHLERAAELEPDDLLTVERHEPQPADATGARRASEYHPVGDVKPRSVRSKRMMPSTAAMIAPARRVRGRLRVPGDKSISHRYAILASLAGGRSRVAGYLAGRRLPIHARLPRRPGRGDFGRAGRRGHCYWDEESGVSVRRTLRSTPVIRGRPCGCWPAFSRDIRLRAALIGDLSLSGRPMRRVIEPLERMGARIEAVDGHAPLVVHGARLARHRPRARRAERAGQERGPAGGAPRRGDDHGDRAGADARSHRARAGGVRRRARRRGPPHHDRRRPVARRARPRRARRLLLGRVLARRGGGAPRVADRDRGRRPQSDAHGAARRAPPLRRDRARRGHGRGRRRTARHGPRRGRRHRPRRDWSGRGALAHRRAAGDRGAGRARRRGPRPRRGGAAREGKRSHRDPRRRIPRASASTPTSSPTASPSPRVPARAAGGAADARDDHRMAMAFAIAALGAERPSHITGADSVSISYPGFFETLGRLVA